MGRRFCTCRGHPSGFDHPVKFWGGIVGEQGQRRHWQENQWEWVQNQEGAVGEKQKQLCFFQENALWVWAYKWGARSDLKASVTATEGLTSFALFTIYKAIKSRFAITRYQVKKRCKKLVNVKGNGEEWETTRVRGWREEGPQGGSWRIPSAEIKTTCL